MATYNAVPQRALVRAMELLDAAMKGRPVERFEEECLEAIYSLAASRPIVLLDDPDQLPAAPYTGPTPPL